MNTIELFPPLHVSELETVAYPPRAVESAPERPSAGAVLVMVWLSLLKFWALLLLAAVMFAAVVPGLVVLALVFVIVAPPYLVLRRFRGGV
jgi:hypothetical protein